MELTEDQLSEIQMKVSDATSDAFRETIVAFVKAHNESQKAWDGDHIDFKVCENTIDMLFSQACDDTLTKLKIV